MNKKTIRNLVIGTTILLGIGLVTIKKVKKEEKVKINNKNEEFTEFDPNKRKYHVLGYVSKKSA